jgi:hypothetical protein
VRNDQMVLRVHRELNVASDDPGTAAARCHGARAGMTRHRQQFVRLNLQLAPHPWKSTHFPPQRAIFSCSRTALISKPVGSSRLPLRFRRAIAGRCPHLLPAFVDVARRAVLAAAVHSLESAAIDYHPVTGQQLQAATQVDEASTYVANGQFVIAAKVGDRLEVRCKTPCQPDQFDIALALQLEAR